MGRLVRLHPLAVVVAVTAGSLLGGIIGAVVAVPLVAVVNVVIRTYRGRSLASEDVGSVAEDRPVAEAPVEDALAEETD
jgi:predicted PurR-regulated permease PerM